MKRKYKVTWQSFILLPAVFVGWTLVTIDSLRRLEKGEGALMILPMIPIYRLFGYWPTVLIPPVLGILCIIALFVVYFHERRNYKNDA